MWSVEFMAMWGWQKALLNQFLNWSLKNVVMCCYQTSTLLLVTGISYENVEQQTKERGVKKQKKLHLD
jgi:hypothetical protein